MTDADREGVAEMVGRLGKRAVEPNGVDPAGAAMLVGSVRNPMMPSIGRENAEDRPHPPIA